MEKNNQRFGRFLLLWSGEFVSAIGSGLTAFGLGIYVFQLTGKASDMAFVTLLAFVPPLVLGPFAGVLADRFDRRLMMILGDGLSVSGLLFILICMVQGNAKLWQIYLGVTISAIFSSLMEPAYRATVTDMLDREQYSKASGLVQIASSSKYLISPLVAGLLLTRYDIKLLLIIDICSFCLTVITTMVVKKGIVTKIAAQSSSVIRAFQQGWASVVQNKGVLTLTMMAAVLTFFVGYIQVLSLPLLLSFTNSFTAGTLETIIALGMLLSSIVLGIMKIRMSFVKLLSLSLFVAGLVMIGFGSRENVWIIGMFGFLFFTTLPFINTALDYLIRTNVDHSVQGRAWSLIATISQLGSVFAFLSAGLLADYVFNPLLRPGGAFTGSIGLIIGVGENRGIGLLIILAGLFLSVSGLTLYRIKSVHALEKSAENSKAIQAVAFKEASA